VDLPAAADDEDAADRVGGRVPLEYRLTGKRVLVSDLPRSRYVRGGLVSEFPALVDAVDESDVALVGDAQRLGAVQLDDRRRLFLWGFGKFCG